jgi:rhodanese-related sulfurtransferase
MDSVGNAARSGTVTTVAQLLEAAREGLPRLSPEQAHEAVRAGAALVDIRSDEQRHQDGEIACATCIPRNVLEWRLDPACPHRDRELARRDRIVIVVCDEGYQSSLAAATLRRFGLDAADVIGGFQAWRAAGLPVERWRRSGQPRNPEDVGHARFDGAGAEAAPLAASDREAGGLDRGAGVAGGAAAARHRGPQAAAIRELEEHPLRRQRG